MNRKLYIKFLLLFAIVMLVAGINVLKAQSISNAGTEFWSVFPTHEPNYTSTNPPLPLYANITVFITGSQTSSGTVTCGSFVYHFTVTPNLVTTVNVPRNQAYISDSSANVVLTNKAIHILVDAGMPKVVVYSHIFAGQRSGATLILPKEALSQKYYSMNYAEYSGEGENYICIVATQANTKVHIKKGTTDLVPGGITLPNVNDVYEYLSPSDLTGLSISVDTLTSGCNSFAVFSGDSGDRIPQTGCSPQSLDPLYQQLYPIESWGVHYAFVPFSMVSPNTNNPLVNITSKTKIIQITNPVRSAGQFVRVLAKDNNTVVSINGTVVATLNSGQYYTTPNPLTVASYITANNPISVAQYALTEACANLTPMSGTVTAFSDPDMVILNPIEYNIKNITVYSSTLENIVEEYFNIVMKTSATSSFKINGAAPNGTFVPMANLPGYSYMQLDVTQMNTGGTQSFNLSASDGFNAIAYGFGNVESYSYSAGTNLASSQTISAINTSTGLAIDSGCVSDNFFFKLELPFKPPLIDWKMDLNEADIIQNNPTPTLDTVNGVVSYVYTLPKTPAYSNIGSHTYKILASYPTTSLGCSTGQQEIDGTFFVVPLPVTSFTATPQVCNNKIYDFKDKSTEQYNTITQWLWNFGDGQTSTTQNPEHTYPANGTYKVKLTVKTSTGCQSSDSTNITIVQRFFMGVKVTSPDCSNRKITLKDISTTVNFTTATRKWYFGNGDSSIVKNIDTVVYNYTKPGTYTIKLVLIGTNGCASDTLSQQIVVSPSPIAAFNVPGVCIADVAADFTDQSKISDGSNVPISYQWNFGNTADFSGANTSTLQNPSYKYTQAGYYLVTLVVSTPAGCTDTLRRQIYVNSGPPHAGFTIAGQGPYCSGQPVVINYTGTINPGVVTKVEYYFDLKGHPTTKVVIDSPKVNSTYTYTYPAFYLPTQDVTVYNIKQVAYSGTLCKDSITLPITILPVPKVTFGTLSSVCLLANPFQLTQGAETTTIAGTGTYSGDGITGGNTFNPFIAGIGTHKILYTFTSTAGCTDTASQSITVLANPILTTQNVVYVLQGNSVHLKPTATAAGSGALSYSWMPTTALNNSTILDPTASPTDNITYTLTVTNTNCSTSDTVHVIVLKPPVIPNTFTPNGDNINDVWSITHLSDYPDAVVEVFNRYGQRVFYSSGYGKPWDGKYNGQPVPVGTYYYKIDPKNGQKIYAGSVTVIR